jgi:hypothetical protein
MSTKVITQLPNLMGGDEKYFLSLLITSKQAVWTSNKSS